MTSRDPQVPDAVYQHYVAVVFVTTVLMLAAVPAIAATAHLRVSWPVMWSAFAAAGVGTIVSVGLLWGPFAHKRAGLWVLYVWSLIDVAALGAIVATSGGERSWFWVVFVLTTIFFSVGYPMNGQVALLLATLATFVLASLIGTTQLNVASLEWKVAVLVAVFGMASFPATELRRKTSEQRRARNEADDLSNRLARRELWWRSLIDRTSDPILVFDSEWRFTFASPAFDALLGYSSEATGLMNLASVIHPNDLERVRAAAGDLRPDAPIRTTCRLQAADGAWHAVELSIAKVDDSIGGQNIVNLHDVTERVASEAALSYQATHDSLTGLANRTAFNDALGTCLSIAARGSNPISILMLDLENFKQVNDTVGHAAGDELLVEVGRRLVETLGSANVVARLGGDEFAAVLAAGCNSERALVAARRVLWALDEPVMLSDRPFWLRGSIGVACTQGDGSTSDELMGRADRAMYEAKRTGVGVALFDPQMEGTDAARFSLLGELRRAIPRGELRLVYQPKVSPQRGVVGVEALVRWQHHRLGLLAPAAFLPVAERSGLVSGITGWVFPTALRQLFEWVAGGRDLSVSVNVSAQDLADEQFPARVEGWLREARVAPERLIVELTETSAISDHVRGTGTLAKLRASGVRVSLDDFGTGYSSLAYLAQLPLDEIKLDRGFLATGLGTDGFLMRSIVNIGQHLGATVVAEGVETEDVLAQVVDCGCDVVQGYIYARPLPPDDVAAFIDRWEHVPEAVETA